MCIEYPYFPHTIISTKHNPRLAQQCTNCKYLIYDNLVDFHFRCYRPPDTKCDYKYKKQDAEDYEGPCYLIFR